MASHSPGKGTKTWSLNLPEHLTDAIDEICALSGKSRNSILSAIIADAVASGSLVEEIEAEHRARESQIANLKKRISYGSPPEKTAFQKTAAPLLKIAEKKPEPSQT